MKFIRMPFLSLILIALCFAGRTKRKQRNVKNMFNMYQEVFGHKINFEHVNDEGKRRFQHWMSVNITVKIAKYLGLPTYAVKPKQEGCVWFRREVVKREKSEREYEKREICEK